MHSQDHTLPPGLRVLVVDDNRDAADSLVLLWVRSLSCANYAAFSAPWSRPTR
jgi:hypothetical protein